MRYYEATRSQQALDRATAALEEAARLNSNSPRRAEHLRTFVNCLLIRYESAKTLWDINAAVAVLEEAVEIAKDEPQGPEILNSLGTAYYERFSRNGKKEDLERAVKTSRDAVTLTPVDRADRHIVLYSLGTRLVARYQCSKSLEDLNQSIEILTTAMEASPPGSFYRAQCCDVLAGGLRIRYKLTKEVVQLERAIDLLTESLEHIPPTHSKRALHLRDLAITLSERYHSTRAREDAERLSDYLKEAWSCHNTSPINRIGIGKLLAACYVMESNWTEARKVLEHTIQLLPLVSPRTLNPGDQQVALREVTGLASLAAAAALNDYRGGLYALQLLEAGRRVIARLLLEKRADTSLLAQKYPRLAERLISLWDELGLFDSIDSITTLDPRAQGWDFKEKGRREADKQLDALLTEIRAKPDFEDFLLPTSAKENFSGCRKGARGSGQHLCLPL
jgi:tetratricopeptide (TPR) repeat protein